MSNEIYVHGAERMMIRAKLGSERLWVRFADDVEGVVPLKALKLTASPVRVSLPDPYVLHLELADGTVEEIPWDYLRHFAINVEYDEDGGVFVAFSPGVGGVYEEGATKEQAIENAYEAACAILEARAKMGEELEDFAFIHHPKFRKDLEEALDDTEAGRVVSLKEAASQAKREQ